MEKPYLSYSEAPVKIGFILCVYFRKARNLCHDRRPVSRDRRILIIKWSWISQFCVSRVA